MWKNFFTSALRTAHALLLIWGLFSAGATVYLAGKLSVSVDLLSASLSYAAEEPGLKNGSHR